MTVIKDTWSFPSILNENKIKPDEEDLSYDIASLFTNVPIDETITYIINQINIHIQTVKTYMFENSDEKIT